MKKEEEEEILLQLDVREINERYIYPFIDLSHIKKLLQFEGGRLMNVIFIRLLIFLTSNCCRKSRSEEDHGSKISTNINTS